MFSFIPALLVWTVAWLPDNALRQILNPALGNTQTTLF